MKIHEALSQLADFARCGYGNAPLLIIRGLVAGSQDDQTLTIEDFTLSRYTIETDGSIKLWDPVDELAESSDAAICIVAQIAG
jgi:hypothetical protein